MHLQLSDYFLSVGLFFVGVYGGPLLFNHLIYLIHWSVRVFLENLRPELTGEVLIDNCLIDESRSLQSLALTTVHCLLDSIDPCQSRAFLAGMLLKDSLFFLISPISSLLSPLSELLYDFLPFLDSFTFLKLLLCSGHGEALFFQLEYCSRNAVCEVGHHLGHWNVIGYHKDVATLHIYCRVLFVVDLSYRTVN